MPICHLCLIEDLCVAFEYFSQQGKRALDLAQAEARRCRQSVTMPEHILVGICASGSVEGERLSTVLDLKTFQEYLPLGPGGSRSIPLPLLGSEANQVINHAVEAAQTAGEPSPGCGSLLQGLVTSIDVGEAPRLTEILKRCGCDRNRLLEAAVPVSGERRQAPRRRRWETGVNEEARAVLREADREARRLHHAEIGDGHLLLALSHEGIKAGQVLKAVGLDPVQVRDWVRGRYPKQASLPDLLPLTDPARKIMETVTDRSVSAGKPSWNSIGLLTVLIEQGGDSKQLLERARITTHQIYRELDPVMGVSRAHQEETEELSLATLDRRLRSLEKRLEDMSYRLESE